MHSIPIYDHLGNIHWIYNTWSIVLAWDSANYEFLRRNLVSFDFSKCSWTGFFFCERPQSRKKKQVHFTRFFFFNIQNRTDAESHWWSLIGHCCYTEQKKHFIQWEHIAWWIDLFIQILFQSIFFFFFSEASTRSVLFAYSIIIISLASFSVLTLNTLMAWRLIALICSLVPVVAFIGLCFVWKI